MTPLRLLLVSLFAAADDILTDEWSDTSGIPQGDVDDGWECDGPPGPCRIIGDDATGFGGAAWNLDDECADSLEEHTWWDSGGFTVYTCEWAVDQQGCGYFEAAEVLDGPGARDGGNARGGQGDDVERGEWISSFLFQYELMVECCTTCTAWRNRPTPAPLPAGVTPRPTTAAEKQDDEFRWDDGSDEIDDPFFVHNVSCVNGSLVPFGAGLSLEPGGKWVAYYDDEVASKHYNVTNATYVWNGTDCVPRSQGGAEVPEWLVLLEEHGATVASLLIVIMALTTGVCALEERRKRLIRVHGDAPMSLTEDNKSFFRRLGEALWDLIQSLCFDCGIVLPRSLNRTQFLATRYNDFGGAVFKLFVELKINGDQRLKWLDAYATLDKDASNGVDYPEFLEYFELPRNAYAKRLYDAFDTDRTGAVPIRDFLEVTWLTCPVDRSLAEAVAFRLLRRDVKFDEKTSTIDLKDVEHFVATRYRDLSRAAAKKKAHHIFAHIDRDGSGGIDLEEFREFSRGNPIFLALGHWYQTKLRTKMFGIDYWKTQTKKRSGFLGKGGRYTYDKKYLEDMDTVVKRRWAPDKGRSFWDDFPEVYERCVAELRERTTQKATLANLHFKMQQDLHRKLIAALEHLCTDARSLEGAFARWRARARQITKMRRALEVMTGADEEELGVDETVHASIVEGMARATLRPPYEVADMQRDAFLKAAIKPRSTEAVMDFAQLGSLRPRVDDGESWRHRDDPVQFQPFDARAYDLRPSNNPSAGPSRRGSFNDEASFVSNVTF